MCWGVPAMVVSVSGQTATVDLGGATKEVLVAMEGISPGQLVVVHAGIAIGGISREDVVANVSLYRDIRERELVDSGMDEKAAEKMATGEMDKLLESLGISGSLMSGSDETWRAEAREEVVPGNAFRRSYRVSLSDTDYLQVMHYTNYLRFCERAQQELLEGLGFSYATLIHKFGLFIPTAETSIKLTGPVRLDNVIEVAVWAEEIGRKHIKFKNVVRNITSGRVVADCLTVSICTDTTLMESMPLPPGLAEALKRYSAEAGG